MDHPNRPLENHRTRRPRITTQAPAQKISDAVGDDRSRGGDNYRGNDKTADEAIATLNSQPGPVHSMLRRSRNGPEAFSPDGKTLTAAPEASDAPLWKPS